MPQSFERTAEQVSSALEKLSENSENSKKGLRQLFLQLNELETLQLLGRSLQLWQLEELLTYVNEESSLEWKLLPLFIGVNSTLFEQLMGSGAEPHRQILEKIAPAEPIQHHLTLFAHEIENYAVQQYKEAAQWAAKIDDLKPAHLSARDVVNLTHTFDGLCAEVEAKQNRMTHALALAWSGGNQNLIAILSTLSERLHHLQSSVIGRANSHHHPLSGLYLLLELKLADVFSGSSQGNEANLDNLKDDESPFEALAKLSLWYLQDYWEVGLLPNVREGGALDEYALQGTGEKMLSYREEVAANLQRLGLNDVKAFKQNKLFSRRMLADFIAENRKLLT